MFLFRGSPVQYAPPADAPPGWAPAPELSHQKGLWNEALEHEYEEALRFCEQCPSHPPKLLPSDVIERINKGGCKAWSIELPDSSRFEGKVKSRQAAVDIETKSSCKDVSLFSDLPLMAGLYDIQGKAGVYYEVTIHKMEGIIAIGELTSSGKPRSPLYIPRLSGSACRPYPPWRLPGWNRLSAGLHLDDFRKFFEDSDGGRDYTNQLNHISPGDVIGYGYEFVNGSIFYTYNGYRLPIAFTGVYLPRQNHDVYAAVGLEGENAVEVNFGGELFKWKEGNEWAWRVEGHVGRLMGSSGEYDLELPLYAETLQH
jgi:hypothetical protein